MKKFISLLLCVLMLFSLAACASDANTPAADAPAADSTEPSPNQNDAPASDSDDTVEITMLSWRCLLYTSCRSPCARQSRTAGTAHRIPPSAGHA